MKRNPIFRKDDPPMGIVDGRFTKDAIFDLVDGEIVEIKTKAKAKTDSLYSRVDSFLLSLKKG